MLGHIDDVTGGLYIWYVRSKCTIDAGFSIDMRTLISKAGRSHVDVKMTFELSNKIEIAGSNPIGGKKLPCLLSSFEIRF